MWQGLQSDSISAGNSRLLMIFVGVVALSMFVQMVVVIAAAVGASRTQKKVLQIVEDLRSRATPMIDKAESLVIATLPKIHSIGDNLLETSQIVKTKAQELDVTIGDVNMRTRAQVVRVDGMVTTALTATSALAEMVHKGVRTPLLEVSGVVNGLKAGMEVLFTKSRPDRLN